jgi:hypothetical protein
MKSQYPCLIKDTLNEEYAPKGWMAYKYWKPWVKYLNEAKVYRNSAGAKNALQGAFDRYYKGPKRSIEIVEFHKEMEKVGK